MVTKHVQTVVASQKMADKTARKKLETAHWRQEDNCDKKCFRVPFYLAIKFGSIQ